MERPATLRSWLRLLRVPLAPTAAWDAVACLAFALAAAGRPVSDVGWSAWLLLAATSLCAYGFGMVLNDLADRRRDAGLAPDRPLPSGAISPSAAAVAVLVLGGGALALGGGPAGSLVAVAATLALAATYDLWSKRRLVLGAVAMGGTRFANASVAVWPLVLTGAAPWAVLLGPLAIGLYSAGVTVYSTTEEVPWPGRRLAARVLMAAGFLVAALLPWILIGTPTLGLVLGSMLAGSAFTSIALMRRPKPGPAKRQVLEMLLGLYWLAAALAASANGGVPLAGVVALVSAWALIVGSQLLVRALR